MVHGKQGHREEAMDAVNKAIALDPGYDMSYVYRGNLYALDGDNPRAAADYRTALMRNPANSAAREGLAGALARMKEGR
jgi:Tfp pilus assembly protein PilF